MYHASFSDYLKDPSRSQLFAVDEPSVHWDVAFRGLNWLQRGGQNTTKYSWAPSPGLVDTTLKALIDISFVPCWQACIRVPRKHLASLLELLRQFNFDLEFSQRSWVAETADFALFYSMASFLGIRTGNSFLPPRSL
ncbi:hypothetical protein NP233_g12804 [Leucocoprinus birnbaumii]|uniref:Uncharacterized protein n=1 Tax=Leucocoprinus birnbaumii TaxID=56174 RepID=A0AAD5YK34_9AGAR|nr:hypothetical protein NP233_g12804 [Leucocoprinus birnbaumii]